MSNSMILIWVYPILTKIKVRLQRGPKLSFRDRNLLREGNKS